MRYVIVCNIKGEALKYHETFVEDICTKFNVRRQKLPAHFTLKAPFETEKILELEASLKNFCLKTERAKVSIQDFSHFRDNVIFMTLYPSEEALNIYHEFISTLRTFSWLDWKEHDGEGKNFHCTIVSKGIRDKFKDIWNYVSKFHCSFQFYFDNISIYQWTNNTWTLYHEFTLK